MIPLADLCLDQVRLLGSQSRRICKVRKPCFDVDSLEARIFIPLFLIRSRSVYERALDVEATDVKLWLSYTEMVRGMSRRSYQDR
jgi:hypothetical protein